MINFIWWWYLRVCFFLLTYEYVLVALLLAICLPVEIHLDGIDGGQVMKIESLAPETEIGFEFGRCTGVQGVVQTYLAKVSLFRGQSLSLQQPDLQRIVGAARLFSLRLHGFAKTRKRRNKHQDRPYIPQNWYLRYNMSSKIQLLDVPSKRNLRNTMTDMDL